MDFTALKERVIDHIYQNNSEQITGQIMQETLIDIIDTIFLEVSNQFEEETPILEDLYNYFLPLAGTPPMKKLTGNVEVGENVGFRTLTDLNNSTRVSINVDGQIELSTIKDAYEYTLTVGEDMKISSSVTQIENGSVKHLITKGYLENKYYNQVEVDELYDLQKVLNNGSEAVNSSIILKHSNNNTGFYPIVAATTKSTLGFTKGGQFTVYAEPNGYLNFYTGLQQGGSGSDLSQIQYFGYRAAYGHTLANTTTAKIGTYFGRSSGFNTTGDRNTFIGHDSGYNLTSGNANTVIGSYRFPANTVLNNNIVLGDGRNAEAGIGFRVLEDGTTTVPRQTQSVFNADLSGKAVVTKEILTSAIGGIDGDFMVKNASNTITEAFDLSFAGGENFKFSGDNHSFEYDDGEGIGFKVNPTGLYFNHPTYKRSISIPSTGDSFVKLPSTSTQRIIGISVNGIYADDFGNINVRTGGLYTAGEGIDITDDEISLLPFTDTTLGGVKVWAGTQSEFNSIETYRDDTLYYVEDIMPNEIAVYTVDSSVSMNNTGVHTFSLTQPISLAIWGKVYAWDLSWKDANGLHHLRDYQSMMNYLYNVNVDSNGDFTININATGVGITIPVGTKLTLHLSNDAPTYSI